MALLDALGTALYTGVISWVMNNGERFFGQSRVFGPVAFLLLFILSASVTGSLVLGRPILMYLENKKREAVSVFIYTLVFLALIVIGVLLGMTLYNVRAS